MAPRFDNIRFNLMRAIEIFEDLNHEDMDVSAPGSSDDYFKERELANNLNQYLGDLIEDGFFDDCDLRDEEGVDDANQDDGSLVSTPRSSGFEYDANSAARESPYGHEDDEELDHDEDNLDSQRRGSSESFTHRFKRYIKRMLPSMGISRRGGGAKDRGHRDERSESGRSNRSLSLSLSHEDVDDRPYDPEVVDDDHRRHRHHRDSIHDHHHRSETSIGGRQLSHDEAAPAADEDLQSDEEEEESVRSRRDDSSRARRSSTGSRQSGRSSRRGGRRNTSSTGSSSATGGRGGARRTTRRRSTTSRRSGNRRSGNRRSR